MLSGSKVDKSHPTSLSQITRIDRIIDLRTLRLSPASQHEMSFAYPNDSGPLLHETALERLGGKLADLVRHHKCVERADVRGRRVEEEVGVGDDERAIPRRSISGNEKRGLRCEIWRTRVRSIRCAM